FCFCFHMAVSPQCYTLSLHDALPISLRQEGPTVFRWAVWDMADVAKQALDVAGVSARDLAAFIPHQANMRIIDELAKQLKLPKGDRKSTRLNSSHVSISYAVFCLKKK